MSFYAKNRRRLDPETAANIERDEPQKRCPKTKDLVEMENAGVNRNIISPILAHKVKGVDKHYSEHDIKDFLEKFKKALPYLLPQSIEKIKAESEEQAQKIAQLEKDVEALESEIVRKIFQNTFESTVESSLHAIEVVKLENMLKRPIELKSSEDKAEESKQEKKEKVAEH